MLQKPYHKVRKYLIKGFRVIGIVYWLDGFSEAVMSKERGI